MVLVNLQSTGVFSYNRLWQDNHYAIKQAAPVINEEPEEIIVVTVYTFFF